MSNQVSEPVTASPVADDWDDEWLAAPTRRSRWRSVLVLALAASLVFLAGVEVQKRFGTASGGSSALAGAPAGFPSGMPSGGFPSGMAAPGGDAGADAGADTGADSGSDSGGDSGAGAETRTEVIGTVIAKHGDIWVVKDLGGTKHRITVTEDTRFVRQSSLSASDVAAGATVDITTISDDAGSAATVIVR